MVEEYKKIILKKENNIATIILNRPEVLNALDLEMEMEIGKAIWRVWEDDEVRVVVLTGAGRAFCAGRDIKMAYRGFQEGGPRIVTGGLGRPGGPWTNSIDLWLLPKPVIAAVNGDCIGGGLSLALACDIIVASEKARFGMFFIRRGLIASGCSTWLLPRYIGPHKAKQLLFFGELISAREAEKMGLVNYVFPENEFETKVKELAEKLARMPAKALSMMKRLVNEGYAHMWTMEQAGIAEKLVDDEILFPRFQQDIMEGWKSFLETKNAKYKQKGE